MRKIQRFVALPAAVALALIVPSSAFAATEFGDPCVANEATSEVITVFGVSAPGDPLPLVAPNSGVLTSWKLNLVPGPTGIPQTLDVLRLDAGTKTAQVIGESSASVNGGSNVISTRIPIQAGDRLAIVGPAPYGTLVCETAEPTTIGGFVGTIGTGATSPYVEVESELRIPAVGVIEPDADGDGYGDETQDACPQSAATQAPCPTVVLSTSSKRRNNFVTVLITSNVQAAVTVAGKVRLGKKGSAALRGGTQVVSPGALAQFTVPFPAKLKKKLKHLSRKRFLTLRLTASAPNVVGEPTNSQLKVKVRGMAKPRRHKRRTHHKRAKHRG